ncbi:MAG TPA: TetR/AcrR family transcriptional regulator [Pseudomonadales bacterium]
MLDAGIALFSLKGFAGTSIAEVAELAGIKKSLVMHHFPTKDILWRECVDDIYARVDAFFIEEYGREPPETVEDLKRMQQVYVRACFRFPGYVRIPLVEGTEDNERVRWLAERHIKRHHAFGAKAYSRVAKRARLPYDRLKFASIRTGWLQLLVANRPLYEHVTGKAVITEKEMLKWSDQLFDLIFDL